MRGREGERRGEGGREGEGEREGGREGGREGRGREELRLRYSLDHSHLFGLDVWLPKHNLCFELQV